MGLSFSSYTLAEKPTSLASISEKNSMSLLRLWSPAPEEVDHFRALLTVLTSREQSLKINKSMSRSYSSTSLRDVDAKRVVSFVEEELLGDYESAHQIVRMFFAYEDEINDRGALTRALDRRITIDDVFRIFRLASCAQMSSASPLTTFGQLALTILPRTPSMLSSMLTVTSFSSPGSAFPSPPAANDRSVLLVFNESISLYKKWFDEEQSKGPVTFYCTISVATRKILNGVISDELEKSLSTIMMYKPYNERETPSVYDSSLSQDVSVDSRIQLRQLEEQNQMIVMDSKALIDLGQFVSACNGAFLASLNFDLESVGLLTNRLLHILRVTTEEVISLSSPLSGRVTRSASREIEGPATMNKIEVYGVTTKLRKHYDRMFEECNSNPLLVKVPQEAFCILFVVQLRLPINVSSVILLLLRVSSSHLNPLSFSLLYFSLFDLCGTSVMLMVTDT